MALSTPPGDPASAAMRFDLREALAYWNTCLDAGDVQALTAVSSPDILLVHEDTVYEGRDALARFVAVHGGGGASAGAGGVARRTHVNHVQAWREGDRVVTRSLTMVVQLVPDTSPFGSGAAAPGWVGYAEDEFDVSAGRPVLLTRRFVRWGGEVLAGFPSGEGVAA